MSKLSVQTRKRSTFSQHWVFKAKICNFLSLIVTSRLSWNGMKPERNKCVKRWDKTNCTELLSVCLSPPSCPEFSQQVGSPVPPVWWRTSSDLWEPPLPRTSDLTTQRAHRTQWAVVQTTRCRDGEVQCDSFVNYCGVLLLIWADTTRGVFTSCYSPASCRRNAVIVSQSLSSDPATPHILSTRYSPCSWNCGGNEQITSRLFCTAAKHQAVTEMLPITRCMV